MKTMKRIFSMLLVLSMMLLLLPLSAFAVAKPGDMNEDEAVDISDVISLLLHITMPDVFPLNVSGDLDENGKADVDDAVFLLLHVSMPELFPFGGNEDHDHIFEATASVEPTCTKAGYTDYLCSCGAFYSKVAAAGHTWGAWEVVYPGLEQRTCQVCQETEKQEVALKLTTESTVDQSVSLTGTTYEAQVRKYVSEHKPSAYVQEAEAFYFTDFIPDEKMMFLTLSNIYGNVIVSRNPGQQGTLIYSEIGGRLMMEWNTPYRTCVEKMVSEANAQMGKKPDVMGILYYIEGENGEPEEAFLQYASLAEIPEDVLMVVAQGYAYLEFAYAMGDSIAMGVACGLDAGFTILY